MNNSLFSKFMTLVTEVIQKKKEALILKAATRIQG